MNLIQKILRSEKNQPPKEASKNLEKNKVKKFKFEFGKNFKIWAPYKREIDHAHVKEIAGCKA